MMISVIISHYKNVANLALILDALDKQSVDGFEVIISEDGQDDATKQFLASSSYSFPWQHTTQEDIGFRKTRILNTSVKKAKGSFLVLKSNENQVLPRKGKSSVLGKKRSISSLMS